MPYKVIVNNMLIDTSQEAAIIIYICVCVCVVLCCVEVFLAICRRRYIVCFIARSSHAIQSVVATLYSAQ